MSGVMLTCAAAPPAQDSGQKITVPLHDPSRPPHIHAHLLSGAITVRGADIHDVIVETRSRAHEESHDSDDRPERAAGMKRLEFPGNAGLDVVEDNNEVNIKTSSWNGTGDLVITAPRHSSLELKSVNNGDIHVEQIDGEIDANDLNGKITLLNVSGSVVAHSLNGEVIATLDRIDPAKPMSFSTMNGNIDVTFPENLKANVRMKTDNGEIYSDFDVKLDSGPRNTQTGGQRDRDGRYHVRVDRALQGTINGGGPEFQFTSFNGQIYLRKKK